MIYFGPFLLGILYFFSIQITRMSEKELFEFLPLSALIQNRNCLRERDRLLAIEDRVHMLYALKKRSSISLLPSKMILTDPIPSCRRELQPDLDAPLCRSLPPISQTTKRTLSYFSFFDLENRPIPGEYCSPPQGRLNLWLLLEPHLAEYTLCSPTTERGPIYPFPIIMKRLLKILYREHASLFSHSLQEWEERLERIVDLLEHRYREREEEHEQLFCIEQLPSLLRREDEPHRSLLSSLLEGRTSKGNKIPRLKEFLFFPPHVIRQQVVFPLFFHFASKELLMAIFSSAIDLHWSYIREYRMGKRGTRRLTIFRASADSLRRALFQREGKSCTISFPISFSLHEWFGQKE